ncbi:hypothetical protein CCUS01_17151 [Colletotrichum cuscutae]|uniref:Uncharacterized protein n=1 Tax=Colletotrichum cuscutae TaxID=1209917 RepID=A0AAI9V8V1_9PEZI|nr:hypothetical protein CCUS01_17151 [Colletotrichum cuscutae]
MCYGEIQFGQRQARSRQYQQSSRPAWIERERDMAILLREEPRAGGQATITPKDKRHQREGKNNARERVFLLLCRRRRPSYGPTLPTCLMGVHPRSSGRTTQKEEPLLYAPGAVVPAWLHRYPAGGQSQPTAFLRAKQCCENSIKTIRINAKSPNSMTGFAAPRFPFCQEYMLNFKHMALPPRITIYPKQPTRPLLFLSFSFPHLDNNPMNVTDR